MSYLFQFQDGTIKRAISLLLMYCCGVFQFQDGTIKSHYKFDLVTVIDNFNSKMVRLKVNSKTVVKKSCVIFQFQDGTIKSVLAQHQYLLDIYFNSKMVRLKDLVKSIGCIPPPISIPRWYD